MRARLERWRCRHTAIFLFLFHICEQLCEESKELREIEPGTPRGSKAYTTFRASGQAMAAARVRVCQGRSSAAGVPGDVEVEAHLLK